MATQSEVPTAERGYVNAGYGTGPGWGRGVPDDQAEETAAWVWPESVRTATRMRRNGTVGMIYRAVTGPICRPGVFALDPQDADPARVAELADNLDLPVLGADRRPPLRRRGRFSFSEHRRLALLKLLYGHMAFEQVVDAEVLAATGMARLRKLSPRFPRTIAEITVARDGGLESITQYAIGTERPEPIPVAWLVWYAHEREGASWQGTSMFRDVYGNWLRLDRLLRARAYLMERQSSGMPVGMAAPGSTQDEIDVMRDIAVASRAGDQSGVGIPAGSSLTFEGVRGTLPDIGAAIADERAQMADAAMAAFLRLGTAEASGNRALGETFVDQFAASVDSVAGDLADVFTGHVIEDLWDWNYGPEDPAPALVTRPVDAERDIDPKDLVELVKAGVVVADSSLEDLQRARYRLGRRVIPAESPPAPPAPTTAAARASRRRSAHLSAATATAAVEWRARVAELLSTLVDSEAIATAVAAGDDASTAVAAGLSIEETAPLAELLVELWSDAYDTGAESASSAVTKAARPGRRPTVVVASLTDIVARAGEIAAGILSSLADRLAASLGWGEAEEPAQSVVIEILASTAADTAAAERIAFTEYHRSTIAGAVDTWAGMGITETRWVRYSGDDTDDDCGDRDGETSSDWGDLPPLHPNCQCLLEPA